MPLIPFEWTIGQTPLVSGLDTRYGILAAAVSCAFFGCAFYIYEHRDIAS